MSAHALVRQFAALCAAHDTDGFAAVVAEDYVQHNPLVAPGLQGLQQGFRWFLAVFPDLAVRLDEVIAEGDRVAARFTWSGTHRAEFLGMAATGRFAEWTSMDFWRVADGRLAEHWDSIDWAQLRQQLQDASA